MTTTAGEFDDLHWRNPAPHAAAPSSPSPTKAMAASAIPWNEELHAKLQELKAADNRADRERLVKEAIALLRGTTLNAVATEGCNINFEQPNVGGNPRERSAAK